MRTLIRPTAFVDSPFGHDGKVARLAGGLGWFAAVELLTVEGHRRTGSALLSVAELEQRLDERTRDLLTANDLINRLEQELARFKRGEV